MYLHSSMINCLKNFTFMKLTSEIKFLLSLIKTTNAVRVQPITDENYARFGDGIFEIKMEEEYKNEFMVPKEFKELQI